MIREKKKKKKGTEDAALFVCPPIFILPKGCRAL